MRPNRRAQLVEVAKVQLAERGQAGLRLEQVAAAAGMTIQGLRYHFRTVEELVLAVSECVAADWAGALERILGQPLNLASPVDRIRAHVAILLTGDLDIHDLLVLVHIAQTPELDAVWNGQIRAWLQPPDDLDEPARLRLLHAQVLAEGLFARFAVGVNRADRDHAALTRLALALPQA